MNQVDVTVLSDSCIPYLITVIVGPPHDVQSVSMLSHCALTSQR